jgi:hypothetical protein
MAKERMFHKNDVYDALQFIPPFLSENRTVITCDKKMLTFPQYLRQNLLT